MGPKSKMDLAYVAGLFDGEGCVKICRRHQRGRPGGAQKRYEMYYLDVRITNIDPRMICPLKEQFGGTVCVQPVPKNQRPTFVWVGSAKIALAFLQSIRPWLIAKAEQVDIAIAFQQAKTAHVYRLSPEKRQKERDQYSAITALKYRTFDPVDFGMRVNSGNGQNGKPRAKQPQATVVGVCNEHEPSATAKMCSALHGNMESAAEMTAPR